MSWLRRKSRTDLMGGALMIALGLFAVWEGMNYQIGTLSRMGPGYFPAALGIILALLGLLLLATADDAADVEIEDERDAAPPDWRGWGCIIAGMIAFIVLGAWTGLVLATFALVFISALGDREQTLLSALLLAIGVTVGGILIFSYMLQLQFPLFRWS